MITEAERLLARLVAMPTVTHDAAANEKMLDFIEQYVTARGMHVKRFVFDGHGSLMATVQPDAKAATVMLACHVDVVAGDDTQFTLRHEGTQLQGRGVYDMKFSIAGYLQWIDDRHKAGTLHQYDISLMVVTDEEFGSRDGISGTNKLLGLGYTANVCILPDSTAPGWEIEKIAKGQWRFDLIATGKAAHGSRPWDGDNAALKIIRALNEIDRHFKNHGPTTDTVNIAIIHGGTAFNEVPTQMVASVEIRLVSKASYTKNRAYIEKLCKKYDLSIAERALHKLLEQDISKPLMQSYMDSVETVTSRRPAGFISLAGSDAPHFAEYDIPCIISCPTGGGHHGSSEWIDRDSFLQFVPILHNYLDKVARIQ
jgi:succinyl-diaminopimelate desuccinylase